MMLRETFNCLLRRWELRRLFRDGRWGAALAGLLPPSMEVRPPISLKPWWLWLAAAGAGLLVAASFALIRRRRGRAQGGPDGPTAYEIALREMAECRRILQPEQAAAFASAVSAALRRFVEGRLQLPALEQTSEEFLAAALRHPQLKELAGAELAQFLTACDLVKFAGQTLTIGDMEHLWETADRYIRAVHDQALRRESETAAAMRATDLGKPLAAQPAAP